MRHYAAQDAGAKLSGRRYTEEYQYEAPDKAAVSFNGR
jgi:hypothetical protein